MLTQQLLRFTLLGAEWVLYLLLLLSVVSIGIMIERTLYFSRSRLGDIEALAAELRQKLRAGDLPGARDLLQRNKSPESRIALAGLEALESGVPAVEQSAAAAQAAERLRMEKHLAFLGTLGNNAPFIGLFGTVLGIIRAFHDLSLNTQAGAAAVMAGISEALVATAVGLLVAIPAVIAYNYFNRRTRRILTSAEMLVRTACAARHTRPETAAG